LTGVDPYDLARFLAAQDRDATYHQAYDELRAGRKTGHWMWFVFPQLEGLGRSAMSRRFAISTLAEAAAYLGHPVLGPRLIECTQIVGTVPASSAESIFGGVDARKLHSSMTLFARADPTQPVFRQVLDRFFEGAPDPATEQLLP
jgi:uncharacterized protein (DUF1810 family)